MDSKVCFCSRAYPARCVVFSFAACTSACLQEMRVWLADEYDPEDEQRVWQQLQQELAAAGVTARLCHWVEWLLREQYF